VRIARGKFLCIFTPRVISLSSLMRGNFSLFFYPSLYSLSIPSFLIPIPFLSMIGHPNKVYTGIGRPLTVNRRFARPSSSVVGWLVGWLG